jgi:hypothetical protein
MNAFSTYWDTKVKEIAQKCVNNELIHLMMQTDNENCKDEDIAKLKQIAANYADSTGQYYVSQMIWAVEHDLADGREPGLGGMNSVLQVYNTLKSDSYWNNVWHASNHSVETDEAKNLFALRDELKILVDKMGQ